MAVRGKKYRIAMTIDGGMMQTIFDLLQGEATDFQMKEIGDAPPTAVHHEVHPHVETPHDPPVQYIHTGRSGMHGRSSHGFTSEEQRERWVLQFWPEFEKVMRMAKDYTVDKDDPSILNVLLKRGNSPSSISPIWTGLVRAGKVDRISHARYRIARV